MALVGHVALWRNCQHIRVIHGDRDFIVPITSQVPAEEYDCIQCNRVITVACIVELRKWFAMPCCSKSFVSHCWHNEYELVSLPSLCTSDCFGPGRDAEYCDQHVCMSVIICISICLLISKMTYPNFAKFFVHVNHGHGSVLLWWQCNTLRTSVASCYQQGHVGSKTLLQQNPPVLNWWCRLFLLKPPNLLDKCTCYYVLCQYNIVITSYPIWTFCYFCWLLHFSPLSKQPFFHICILFHFRDLTCVCLLAFCISFLLYQTTVILNEILLARLQTWRVLIFSQVCLSVCLCVSDRHFYPSTLTDFDETWSQGPYCDLVWPRP